MIAALPPQRGTSQKITREMAMDSCYVGRGAPSSNTPRNYPIEWTQFLHRGPQVTIVKDSFGYTTIQPRPW